MSALPNLFLDSSPFHGSNAAFIEELYEHYLQDPDSIECDWRQHFDALPKQRADDIALRRPMAPLRPQVHRAQSPTRPPRNNQGSITDTTADPSARTNISPEKQAAILRLINAHRSRGHQLADLDPLRLYPPPEVPDLSLEYHGLLDSDLDQVFHSGSLYGPERMTLREILARLKRCYCATVGCEYMHITTTPEKRWLQKRIETYQARPELTTKSRRWLLKLLTAAEGIEHHLHRRYVGQKRFSLEGGEALIPLLDELIQRAGRDGIREIVIGMAHRGRLNVLTNILGKPPQDIFAEFEGKVALESGQRAGDVKYHLGFATDIETKGGPVHVALGFNPSHLEIIDPVVQGSVRARQRRCGDHDGRLVLPILIHGDSAFAGQGVVMETLQLSQTRSHGTGGTVHIIINNQIGFTTSNPLDTRSTLYCTDVAKMVQGPVFHVNGDDPEAVIFVTRLALDFRNRFKRDVFIDIVCYRRLGHNEADEPAVTQPLMYRAIRRHPTARSLYAERLIKAGEIASDDAATMVADYRQAIEQGMVVARPVRCDLGPHHRADWRPFADSNWTTPCDTRVTPRQLRELAERALRIPDGFELHPRVAKIWAERQQMAQGEQLINWGFAELLAYATLLDGGIAVRLSGQDAGRGTFFHRHANIHCQTTGQVFTPLQHLSANQGAFVAIDSILSEAAVLGFEYGFATAEPDALTLWEAQFGDFANGAQVVIDQFITSAGTKWGLQCGLTMLLPHGLEGQGAEHSSARLERYLQLCAEHNIQVCVPTTPTQIFHLLRRQMLRPYRRPLIVLTPKSLLRHRLAVSPLSDLSEGRFQPLIPEPDPLPNDKIRRVVLCSGKIYFDLIEARHSRGIEDTAILRVEQLYPFPKDEFAAAMADYAAVDQLIWCQEEAQNQGAWDLIKHRFQPLTPHHKRVYYVGRPASAAPAVGHRCVHIEQQQRLIEEALTGHINPNMNRGIPLP